MYEQEKITPYGKEGDKGELVEAMFDNIAPTYDTLNHRLSWNIDRLWRKYAIKQLLPFHPKTMLDIATGTGDFAILSAQMLRPESLIGIDISEGMMNVGKKKVEECNLKHIISFKKEDCLQLSFADNTFDAITVAFGIRNFKNLDKGLNEMHRVLKPGGHLSILELTTPVNFPINVLFKAYSHAFLPIYGKFISKDKGAYKYLTATIEAFPQGKTMMNILHKAGFVQHNFKHLTLGICTAYFATK